MKFRLIILLLAIVYGILVPIQGFAATTEKKEAPKLELARSLLWTAAAADLVSTEAALQREGVVESNPLMKNRAIRISTKIGVTYAVDHFTKRMKDKKAAFWIRMGLAMGWGAIAGWNFSVSF